METNTLAKCSPSCPLVSPLSEQPCRGPRTWRWITMCQWYGTGSIRMTGPWLPISAVRFQGIFLWTLARRGPRLEAPNSSRFDPVVPVLAPFPREHENLCSVKQAVVTIFWSWRLFSERQRKEKRKEANVHWVPTMCPVDTMRKTERIGSSNSNKNNKNNSKHLCSL